MAQETLKEVARAGLAQALEEVTREVALELLRSDPALREKIRDAILEAFREISRARGRAGLVQARGRKNAEKL